MYISILSVTCRSLVFPCKQNVPLLRDMHNIAYFSLLVNKIWQNLANTSQLSLPDLLALVSELG